MNAQRNAEREALARDLLIAMAGRPQSGKYPDNVAHRIPEAFDVAEEFLKVRDNWQKERS